MKPWSYQRTWSYVLWLLGRRAYATGELARKLGQKGVEAPVIDRVLARLIELDLVDDETYAEMYVRNRKGEKGQRVLRQELRFKGIEESLIDSTLEPLEDVQAEAASALLKKHGWRFQGGDPRRDRARAYAFLARRGFPGEAVQAALDDWQSSLTEEERFD